MRPRAVAALAAAFLAVPAPVPAEEAPSGPPAVVSHAIEVVLDPSTGSLEATDRMTVRRNRGGALGLDLREGLAIRQLEVDGRIQPAVTKETEDPRPGICRYRLAVNPHPGETASVVLTYGGTVREEIRKARDPAFVTGDRLRGTVGPDGVYLADSTGWVPLDGSMSTFAVRATVPEGWTVASQGGVPSSDAAGGRAVFAFPAGIPADGLWLQAGKWRVERRVEKGGVSLGTYLSESNAAHSKLLLDAVEEYLVLYRELLGPFPHAKFDVVENFFSTGYGMPSATLLGGDVIAHVAATASRSGGRIPAGYLDHELVHCWWGNGVGVEYDSGNWCEGLTTYCSNYLRKERESAEEAAKHRRGARARFAARVRPDRDYPLRDFRGKSEDFENDIGYGKASMLCHMARQAVGDEAFFAALRDFAAAFRGRRAGWDDLRRAVEKRGGRNLEGLFSQMLERKGAPVLVLDGCAAAPSEGGWRVTGRVLQPDPAPWVLPVPLVVETAAGTEATTLDLSEGETGFSIRTKDPPLRVLLDPDSHCWRGFAEGEVPATLDATLHHPGGAVCALLPPADAGPFAPVRDALRGRPGVTVVDDPAAHGDASFGAALLLGSLDACFGPSGRWADSRTGAAGAPPAIAWDGKVLRVGAARFEGDDLAVLASIRAEAGPLTLFAGDRPAALAGARRLFFYAGDGVVVFKAGRPVLRLEAEGEESSRATLLESLFPEPSAERVQALVDSLCAAPLEGRLAGTTGDAAAREILGKALEGMGLAPVVQPFAVEVPRWDGESPCLGLAGGEPAPARGVPFLFSPPVADWRKPTPLPVEAGTTAEAFLAALHEAIEKGAEGVLVLGPPAPPKALADYLLLAPGDGAAAPEGPVLHPAMRDSARRARLLLPDFEVKVPVVYLGREPETSWLPAVVRSPLVVDLVETANLLAVIPGSDPALAGEAVLLSAHHDGQGPGFPSANDNASGVAALLEAARALLGARESLRRPVVIALLGAEEWGLRGAAALLRSPPPGVPRPVAVLNLDAVGDAATPAVSVVGETVHPALGTVAARALAGAGLAKGAEIDRFAFAWGSDHYAFHRAGIPAVDLFSMEYRMMHTAEDVPERVSGSKVVPVARAAAAFAVALSRGGAPR
jgi:hypothetical protein